MKFAAVSTALKRPNADLLIVPFFQENKRAVPFATVPDVHEVIEPILKAGDFIGKQGNTLLIYLTEKKEKRLLLLGLGEKKKITCETLRRSFAQAMKQCRSKKWLTVNAILPELSEWSIDKVTEVVAEGFALASYVFEDWKSEDSKQLFHVNTLTLVGAKSTHVAEKVEHILTGVNLARDLVNRNALDVTPQTLAKEAQKLAFENAAIKTSVLDKGDIEREKMGLFLAVANSSPVDPALIIVEYRGDPSSDDLSMVVGKGVTFDTGGLNLKPTNFIEDMRADMGGAASALGIIQAAAATKLKANIVAVIPSTENAIDSHSYKPGDVYRSYLGKTVEITNTDAEGRLILADAIAYGKKRFTPTRIIDLATLTGAVVISLGSVRAGLFSNNEMLTQLCKEAGEETGERVWPLPLDEDYKSLLESDIADLRNAGKKRAAGSVTAALFLEEFVEKTPWIHLDIAGTAFLDSPEHYHLTLATGMGVRLVIRLIEKLCQ